MSSQVNELTPPINYSMLCPGIHRSGYPTKRNFNFLKTLQLRSVMFLCPESYADANRTFCEEFGIQFLEVQMEGNKEPFLDIPKESMDRAVSLLCDTRNHPVLVHCNKGKHRTGTVCGCLRRLQGWSLTSSFDEYLRFAGDKARFVDQQFIELYTPTVYYDGAPDLQFLAPWVVLRNLVRVVAKGDPNYELISKSASFSITDSCPQKSKKNKDGAEKNKGGDDD